jgi:hypothetical protein
MSRRLRSTSSPVIPHHLVWKVFCCFASLFESPCICITKTVTKQPSHVRRGICNVGCKPTENLPSPSGRRVGDDGNAITDTPLSLTRRCASASPGGRGKNGSRFISITNRQSCFTRKRSFVTIPDGDVNRTQCLLTRIPW